MPIEEKKLSNSKLALCWFVVWTSLGILQSIRLYFAYDVPNRDIASWQKVILWGFGEWYLWGILSILLLKVIQWLDLHKSFKFKLFSFISGLVIVPALYLYLYSAFWIITREIFPAQVGTSFNSSYEIFLANYVGKVNDNTVAYFLIVAAIYAFTYYKRLFVEQQRLAESNKLLVEAKLEQLQSQLQPHFLFNTLNTITSLIHSDPERADLMTTQLSDLLRISLDSGSIHEVPLKQEISFLEKYLDIQIIRFEDRMMVSIDIEENTKELLVPYLILQPIVENVIKHSVEKTSKIVQINIHALQKDNSLVMTVSNSGANLASDYEETILKRTGLQNSMERLKQLHQEKASLTIQNNDPSGVIVTVTIPVKI